MECFGRTAEGRPFSRDVIEAVWNKAIPVPGVDERVRRKDRCGAWIDHDAYGDLTPYGAGWEIDHKVPVHAAGSDDLDNLEPLQWQNNRAKDDGPLACPVANET